MSSLSFGNIVSMLAVKHDLGAGERHRRWTSMRALTYLLLLVGCSPPSPAPVPGIAGKPRSYVEAILGPPLHVFSVDLDRPSPFQAFAVRCIPSALGSVHGLSMEELRWRDGDFHVAVFVVRPHGGDGFVVDSVRWHKSIIMC